MSKEQQLVEFERSLDLAVTDGLCTLESAVIIYNTVASEIRG